MKIKNIENIELSFLTLEDYQELKAAMIQAYVTMPDMYWREEQIKILIDRFPEGQVVVKVNNQIAGCALSIILDYNEFDEHHTYEDITGNYTFSTHTNDGDVLYGIDVFIKPDFRGLRLGRRLYDYRKELCERLNLRGVAFGGRIPNYHQYKDSMTPKEYIDKVRKKEIHDPVLNFQISNDFHPAKILKNYLKGDAASDDYAVLLEWDNVLYEKRTKKPSTIKKVVRLGLVQWQMRPYKDLDELMHQVEFFVDAVSGYRSDFALFPEFFMSPLMAENVTPDEAKVWGLQGGNSFKVFDTDCGKIGILICYDSEFPELSRLLADEGMDILFIPFLTDTQNGFSRVRNCAQARAIENECYVAIAGSVGNLPKVHNMDMQYAQSMVFTPCDFAFPANGIKAEATPNTEMVLICDVDIDLLRQLNLFGSVRNLRDRRKDIFDLKKK